MSTYVLQARRQLITGLATLAALGFILIEPVEVWAWRAAYRPRHRSGLFRRATSAASAAAFARTMRNYAGGARLSLFRRAGESYWRGTDYIRHRKPEPVRAAVLSVVGGGILWMSGLWLYAFVAM